MKMKPTIFRATPHPFEPQRLLARGRQFRRVAIGLSDMDGPEPNWPKYFLITHAIELAIKAYITSREDVGAPAPAGKHPANHDLVGLYDYAVFYGLERNPALTVDLPHLSELHQIHYARYPQANVKPVALIAQYDDLVDQLFADVGKAIGG
jgi:hypothetical protein